MGLDMYLYKKTYVKRRDYQPEEKKFSVIVKKGGKKLSKDFINQDKISEITEDVAYWRKANAIHRWFVDNIQGGEDDCKEYYIGLDKLKELLDLCKIILSTAKVKKGKVANGYSFNEDGTKKIHYEDGKVITNITEIKELLPTHSGFFFGSTDYDEYYLDDIRETVKQLEPILINEKNEDGSYKYNSDYYYQSSW